MLLAHPYLAQRVLVLVLEVKRRDIVEDRRRGPCGSDRVGQARLGQGAAVVTRLAAFQRRSQRVPVRGSHAEVLKDPDRGRFRGRLHETGQHHRRERLVSEYVKPQPGVHFREDLPEDLTPRAGDHRRVRRGHGLGAARPEIELKGLLAGVQTLPPRPD
jgi:hypothetical protein